MPRLPKHPEYKAGQMVCRTYKGLTREQRTLIVAEAGRVCENNQGRKRPCVKAWHVDARGRKESGRPYSYLLEEIRPAKKGKC